MVEESNRKGQRLAAIAMIVFGFILWLAQRSANSFMEVDFFLIISLPTIALIICGFIFLKFPEKLPVAMIVFGSIYLVSGFTFTYLILSVPGGDAGWPFISFLIGLVFVVYGIVLWRRITTKICPNCGYRIPAVARECIKCGHKFEQSEDKADL